MVHFNFHNTVELFMLPQRTSGYGILLRPVHSTSVSSFLKFSQNMFEFKLPKLYKHL